MTLKSNKKGLGVLFDGITFVAVIIIAIISITALYPAISELIDDIKGDDTLNNSSQAMQTLDVVQEKFPDWFDGFILTMMVFFAIIIFVSGLLLDVHPVFFIIGIGALLLFGVVGFYFKEAWTDISVDPAYGNVETDFPIISWIMNNFGIIMISYPFLFLIPLFAKAYRGDLG